MPPLPRLYAILDVESVSARGLDARAVLRAWLDAGVKLVQLRAKAMASGPLLELAVCAAREARAAGATLIVNDRADLAVLAGAGGVHLGQDDLTPRDARRVVGDDRLIGLSTHSTAQVEAAAADPVSYIAIGPVFTTATKTGAADPTVGLAGVRAAGQTSRDLPLVAIGGITLENARIVIDAGAASVAVISDLLVGDPGSRARQFLRAVGGPGI